MEIASLAFWRSGTLDIWRLCCLCRFLKSYPCFESLSCLKFQNSKSQKTSEVSKYRIRPKLQIPKIKILQSSKLLSVVEKLWREGGSFSNFGLLNFGYLPNFLKFEALACFGFVELWNFGKSKVWKFGTLEFWILEALKNLRQGCLVSGLLSLLQLIQMQRRCHRSHFGSRYKLGCCGHAGLFTQDRNRLLRTNLKRGFPHTKPM